ncbi:hypothetical protein [Pseudoalteromonas sp. B62]|uniref:hypothetical protein n=1 Tax=Pseudoalteromonas sp. B62 TaxID=630483 RepID=UPI00301B8FDE
MQNKIALMGVSGAGKDFIANHLIKEFDYQRFSFSDQLKRIAAMIYPWLEKDYPPLVKEEPLNITLNSGELITKSPRDIWLHLNALRDIERDIYIRMLNEEITNFKDKCKNILISDIRSEDEFKWCSSNGFKIIYIKANKKIYKSYTIDSQISEMASKADFIFENNFNGLDEFDLFYQDIISNNIICTSSDLI